MSVICEVDDCEWVGQLRRGMCNTHYQQFRKSDEFRPLPPRVCSIPDCDRPHYIRGWCLMHHARWVAHGTTDPVLVPTLEERFTAKLVLMPSGCLEWTGSTNVYGYGQITINYRPIGTHRVAWTLNKGPIPHGLHVLHHCDNPPCCQTDPTEAYPEGHLFLGTQADNNADRDAKGRQWNRRKTHCKYGHEFTEANTYVDRKGQRNCKACGRLRTQRSKQRAASRDVSKAEPT
jgi:hypothetical protein